MNEKQTLSELIKEKKPIHWKDYPLIPLNISD